MTIRLYIDEDAQRQALVRALRPRGTDVVTALEAGRIQVTDDEHLRVATAEGRVLFGFNVRDYYRIHTEWAATGRPHAGIVLARQQQFQVGDTMRRLLRLMATLTAENMRNRIEFLSHW